MNPIKVLCTDGHERKIVKAIDTPTGTVFIDTLGERITPERIVVVKHPNR